MQDEKIRLDFCEFIYDLILNSLTRGFVKEQPQNKIEVKAAIVKRQLIIEYKDNGCGIPEEIIEKVFKLFPQLEESKGVVAWIFILFDIYCWRNLMAQ